MIRDRYYPVSQWIRISNLTTGEIWSDNFDPIRSHHRSYFNNEVSMAGDFIHPNGYRYDKFDTVQMTGEYTETAPFNNTFVRLDGYIRAFPVVSFLASESEAYNQALEKLSNQVRSTIDLSVTIAQRGQVTSMLRKTAKLLVYVKKHPIRALKDSYKGFLSGKSIGSKWLEFQYGWKPLASDIYGTAEQIFKSRPSLTKVKGRGSSQFEQDFIVLGAVRVKGKDNCRVEICVNVKPNAYDQLALSNFTSLNPASIAWELTPWSFVVDWFVDVGGYIRQMETSLLSQNLIESGYVTTVNHQDYSASAEFDGTFSGITYHERSYGSFVASSQVRTPISSFPFPRAPTFKANLGSGRLLNAAALLSQFLRK